MSKPRLLILGGCGFVGRNFVQYLVENELVSKIRVADKVLPATANFSEKVAAVFGNPIVEFKQSNLTNAGSIERAFTDEPKFDYVINLASETKLSQAESVYEEKVRDLAVMCAKQAIKSGVPKWLEVSTAYIYKPGKALSDEDAEIKPHIVQAKFKSMAEEELKKIDGLELIVIRPSIIYGPSDVSGIMPRVITGAVYKYIGEKMKFLWNADFKINTVHVRDVCAAMVMLMEKGKPGDVYNLSDPFDTTQGKVNSVLEEIFDIKTGFQSTIINGLAKMNLRAASEEVNEKHLRPWADLTKEAGILSTPLTPFLDVEVLANCPLAVDGTKIVKAIGFEYKYPAVTKELILEAVEEFIAMKLFPPIADIPSGAGGKKKKK